MEGAMKNHLILSMGLISFLGAMEETLDFERIAKILSSELDQLLKSSPWGENVDSDFLNLRKIEYAIILSAMSDESSDWIYAKKLYEEVIKQDELGEYGGIARNNLAALFLDEGINDEVSEKIDCASKLFQRNLDFSLSENIRSRARLGLEQIERWKREGIGSFLSQLIYIIPESLNRFSS